MKSLSGFQRGAHISPLLVHRVKQVGPRLTRNSLSTRFSYDFKDLSYHHLVRWGNRSTPHQPNDDQMVAHLYNISHRLDPEKYLYKTTLISFLPNLFSFVESPFHHLHSQVIKSSLAFSSLIASSTSGFSSHSSLLNNNPLL